MRHARSYRAVHKAVPISTEWPCALLRIEEEQSSSCSPPRGHEATERAKFDSPESRPSPCAPCLDQPFGRGWRAAWALDRLYGFGNGGDGKQRATVFVRRGAEACATNYDHSVQQHSNDQRHKHLSAWYAIAPQQAMRMATNVNARGAMDGWLRYRRDRSRPGRCCSSGRLSRFMQI